MEAHCILCNRRISDWLVAWNKVKQIGAYTLHKSCLIDFKLRHGHEWSFWESTRKVEMTIRWHALPFTHIEADGSGCGKDAQILEICASADGELCVSGVCIHCGEQFSSPEVQWATIMREVSIKDYRESSQQIIRPNHDLATLTISGRPN